MSKHINVDNNNNNNSNNEIEPATALDFHRNAHKSQYESYVTHILEGSNRKS